MLRGIERRAIFLDDADCEEFLRRLAKLVVELGFVCFAWVLMPNHAHLVLRSAQVRISLLMARLGTGYARYFNQRHDRVGHLFQNRFRSRRVIDDADLMGLVLYVSRNPLEAGLVADAQALERYPWCGLGAVLGRMAPRPFEAVDETLALFAADRARARKLVRRHLGSPDSPCLATSAFARTTPGQPDSQTDFEALLRGVSASHSLTPEALRSRRRAQPIAAARAEVAWRASAQLGLRGAEIARRLGLTEAAVSKMLARRREGTTS